MVELLLDQKVEFCHKKDETKHLNTLWKLTTLFLSALFLGISALAKSLE